MHIDVISLFPEMLESVTNFGVVGRAKDQDVFTLATWNPRDYTHDKYKTVDDKPYGGGPGMVMKALPLAETLHSVMASHNSRDGDSKALVIYLSPQGKTLNQETIGQLAQQPSVILICGRYEGVDERFIEDYVDEQYSIGDYVLSGGELPALVMIEALVRVLPGSLGNEQSARSDSFSEGLLEHPQYTRPKVFNNKPVPPVLIEGNHAKIERWRLKQSLKRTLIARPDLIVDREFSHQEKKLLNEFIKESTGD